MHVSEFVAQLEYHLSQMAAKNDHHRFEKLCVEVARRRIATNIFVATGPVGAGGDGGRDGETFDTALPHEVATWFSVRATTASVAVACSTGDYKKKIPSDVRKILLARDREFDRIVYFSAQVIPSGERLALQEKHATERLAVWDRHAIARVLAEPDLHWVAKHYLGLPASIVEDLEPDNELGLDLDGEAYYVPAQALVASLGKALAMRPIKSQVVSSTVADLQRRHVALHLALDTLPVTDQHAYELSRQLDESARALRRLNSSSAEALVVYGLLEVPDEVAPTGSDGAKQDQSL
ncbi:hypothetical protein [Actinoalloteichus caeruleus]|uniref:hypothetical protein n=1 Tax=Actinoalloteichus cyanogriseus TaxID=2893586 RepID=UPI003AAE2DA5